jgi:type IV secretion system pilin
MNRRNMFRLLIVFTATAVAVAGAVPAYAAEPHSLAVNDLPTIIGNITAWVVGIAFGVATLFATIGFLRYLAAGGDPTEVEKAKSAWKNAAIGYAGALLAPILLTIVKGWIGG